MKKRMMLKRLFLILGVAALVLSGCGANEKKIRFGAAGIGGTYYSFGNVFADIVSGEKPEYEFEVKATAGSAANLRLLADNYIQLAIVQTDLVSDAYNGTGTFDGKEYKGYSAVAGLYAEACQIVVREDSSIETLEDLQGKKVCIGEKESGTEQNARQILAATGLSSKLVEEINLDYTKAAKQLESGEIDAFFCTAGTQTTVIEELAKNCGIRFIGLDENCVQKLKASYDFYTDYVIPAGTYTGQNEDIPTVGVQAVLLANNKLSKETVKSITEILFKNEQDIQYAVTINMQIDETAAVQGITIPFHPGAAEYYSEHGIEVETEKGAR